MIANYIHAIDAQVHNTALVKATPYVYEEPEFHITDPLAERIDELFGEMMELEISESGAEYEMDFNKCDYLESFSMEHKLTYILDKGNFNL